MMYLRGAGAALVLASLAVPASSQDLTQLSLEDLFNIQVTSVSKKEQNLSKIGAAVFVISREDIRRSGANNLPDLLRMVPGVHVARIDSNAWVISIRGFSHRYSSKVLVLIDGRSVYSPTFSGVYWDQQSIPLEDIERIEVIRGPGGTVWGANAMNGVINVITRSARDTTGGLISLSGGSEERARGLFRYGGKAGSKGFYRIFGKYSSVESGDLDDRRAADAWHSAHSGFRTDWNLTSRDALTVRGDWFGASEGQTLTTLLSNRLPDLYTFDDKVRVGTGNLHGNWRHAFSNGSESSFSAYYDHERRSDQILDIMDTGNADFQYRFYAGSRHDIMAGAGYRVTEHQSGDGYYVKFGSGHRRDNLFSAFLQDEIRLTRSLSFTAGSKFEHNAYTGFEIEPSIQLVWNPEPERTLWFSAARAIRQPSWVDAEMQMDVATVNLPGGGFGLLHWTGNPNVAAEKLLDFEGGYRNRVNRNLWLDATVFFSRYSALTMLEPDPPYFASAPNPPHLVLPSHFDNLSHGWNYGGEVVANWQATRRWRLSPGYGFLQEKRSLDQSSRGGILGIPAATSPKHQVQMRSALNLKHNLEWDTSAYYVGALYGMTAAPAYVRLDSRFGWRMHERVEFSVTGQNLLRPRHYEFGNGFRVVPTQVERSVLAKLIWHF